MIRQVNSLAYGMGYFTLLVYVDPVVPVTFQPSFLLVGDKHEQTHTHTLAQKYLIELLMWNASGVHKQSPKV